MTALVEDVTLQMPRGRDWAWADLLQIPDDGHRYEKPAILADAGVPAYWRVELEGTPAPTIAVYALADGAYREVVSVRAGEAVTVDAPFPVELRPADLAGPRRRD